MTTGPDDPSGNPSGDRDLPGEENPEETRIRFSKPSSEEPAAPSPDDDQSGWQPPSWQPPTYGQQHDPATPPADPFAKPAADPYGSPPTAPYGQAGDPYSSGSSASGGYDPYGQGGAQPSDPYAAAPSPGQPGQPYGAYGAGAYGQGYGAAPYGYQQAPVTDSGAVTAMVLGIIGVASIFVLCGLGLVVSPVAMIMGMNAKKRIQAAAGQLGGHGQASTGFITGLIGTILLVIGIIGFVIFLIAGLSGAFDDDPYDPYADYS